MIFVSFFFRPAALQMLAVALATSALCALQVKKINSPKFHLPTPCLLYTSDAADERSSVDLGGRRIINKKTKKKHNNNQRNQLNTIQKKSIKYTNKKRKR